MRIPALVVRVLALRVLVCVSLSLAAITTAFAEGTAQVTPYGSGLVGMQISNISSVMAGPYRGAAAENRVRFYANATDVFYFGIRAFSRPTPPAVPVEIDVYYRILRANGAVEVGPTLIANNAANGRIQNYDEAAVGPNAIAGAGGYDQLTFTPGTGLAGAGYSGEYYIEIYQSGDGGTTALANQSFLLAFFDFTVADNNNLPLNGRVYSQGWSLITVWQDYVNGGGTSNPVSGYPDYSGDPTVGLQDAIFYGYSADSTVSQIQINDIRPLAFVLYFNKYGTDPLSTDWTLSRKSVTLSGAATTLSNGYLVFLNSPDEVVFPRATPPGAPTFPATALRGCPGNWRILVNNTAAGDVELLMNLDGVAGFQPGGADRYLYAYDAQPGLVQIAWDGKDGLGNTVAGAVQFTASAKVLRGRTNMPLFDAELSPLGFSVLGITDALNPYVPNLYWDDSQLSALVNNLTNCNNNDPFTYNNNVTSAGIDVSLEGASQINGGTVFGNRAWDGQWLDGNNPTSDPTESASEGISTPLTTCDDYGNYRILNTWFYLQESNAVSSSFIVPVGCILPVNLLSFNVEKRGTAAQLKWTTANETNFSHFVIERSLDGRSYAAIGTVASQHNPSGSASYGFTDNIASFNGKRIYYRLRQVDIDNSYSYSRVASLISDINGGLLLSGLVNPVKETVRFQVTTLESAQVQIRISDNAGRSVYLRENALLPGTNAIELTSLPALAPGVYLLSVEAKGERQVAKLVISH